jgi:hypothetical protein
MLFQHPWDVKADVEDDEGQALSPDKNEIIDDKTRFDNLSSKLQRYIANGIDRFVSYVI